MPFLVLVYVYISEIMAICNGYFAFLVLLYVYISEIMAICYGDNLRVYVEMLAYIYTAGMKIDSYLPCFSDMSEPIFWVNFLDISEGKNKNVRG